MPKRSAADAAQTRLDILAAARKAFAQEGYAAATTSGIAKAAGVTIGALFHHFESKQQLFHSVFEAVENELNDHARAASRGAPGVEMFLAGFRAFLEFATREDFHRIVMIDGPAVLGESEWRATDARLGLATVLRAVEGMMAAGLIPQQPARPLAVMLLGAMNEAGFALARQEPGVTADDCIATLRRLLG
jgi:AcrR family transcriptional regulator